jgi:hypothetical protein
MLCLHLWSQTVYADLGLLEAEERCTEFQVNHQQDATISSVYYLTFIYSSTRFGHPHAHHQELQLQ